ncbi:MAG: Gfo/Idh/MocA family oxidoreductase [Chloroflexi bacterium]|nr:Gfo/Idh/MocA family oxidoreductase [Chloroflexota bacterium]
MASRTYRMGVIGTAWAAAAPLPAFSTYEGIELHAIASGRRERAEAAAEKYGIPHASDDYREMLAMPELDMVYIAGPNELHRPMVLDAAAAGKHILCEKPIGLNAAEGREMIAAVEAAGVAHVVCMTMRPFATHAYARRLVAEGVIGEPRHYSYTQFAGWGGRGWGWHRDASRGGGMLMAVGSHYIDMAREFVGEWASVSCELRHWTEEVPDAEGTMHRVTADEGFALLGSSRSGAAITIHTSANVPGVRGRRVELYGSEGGVVIDGDELGSGATVRVSRFSEGGQPRVVEVPPPDDPPEVAACAERRFGTMAHALIRAIESGEPQEPNLVDALRVQEVLDAAVRSAREGVVVRLPDPPES